MRVGFFGGTFDPPHLGHLAVAHAAVEKLRLNRLLLVPTGRQPLKSAPPAAPYADRLAMVKLLCSGDVVLEASDLEAPLAEPGPNYTIDTLRKLRGLLRADDEIFVVTGADAFLGLRSWRDPDALLAEAEWIVVSRPGFMLDDTTKTMPEAQRARVHLLAGVNVPVSASELRRRLRDKEDCKDLVPADVLAYIRAHALYQ